LPDNGKRTRFRRFVYDVLLNLFMDMSKEIYLSRSNPFHRHAEKKNYLGFAHDCVKSDFKYRPYR